MTLHGARTTRRLNIDIAEDNARFDPHRGHVSNMNGMLDSTEPVRPVLNNRGRRDLDLRWKQMIAGAEAARPKYVTDGERAPFSPDDESQDRHDRCCGERGNKPRRLKVEPFHEKVMLS